MGNTGKAAAAAALFVTLVSGCTWLKRFGYEGFRRDSWQHPEQVIHQLGIQPGQCVTDLGAGGGYFTFRLADAVGGGGKVYAVDVDPDMTGYLQQRAAREGYGNVDVILAQPDDSRLPNSGVDLIFTCNTYHHIEDRTAYFAYAKTYLRRDGRLAIIESRRTGLFHKLFGHWTASTLIRSEMEAAGYRLEHEYDFLPSQSFLIFSRVDG